ncbi:CtsR family transcriptional regulator [Eubacteriales bacterium OttesenSCG-928-N13]|nr:CtsR family transcriptional regulator [Eubacteriales bacterium OttesenSCG-928-N13]
MAQLSDNIERFIKELMSEDCQIELRRNELAQHFGCAPSQINYVLATRFSIERGYVIDSRRGGGGYVRILQLRRRGDENLLCTLLDQVGNAIEEDAAHSIIGQLLDLDLITENEANLMVAATAKNALALPVNAKDVLRASVLRSMLTQVFRNLEGRAHT